MNMRALVVDDSITFRKVVRDCIAEIPGLDVVDVAKDGIVAIEKIKQHRPDVVTLDVEMPGLDGLQVLEALKREQIETNVIMVSSHTERGAITTTAALRIGAFDFILKPDHDDPQANMIELREQLGTRIEALRRRLPAKTKTATDRLSSPALTACPPSAAQASNRNRNPTLPGELDAICIGISTGGPQALSTLIPSLSDDISVPILIVQHMPPLFTATMANGLDMQSPLTVVEAADGMPFKGGWVYVAPGGKQMRVAGYPGAWRIEITDDHAVRNCKPSVDYLFESASRQFGSRMLAIVMTGMGDDGLAGCESVARRGGRIWAQDQETSTVYGMPRSVAVAGLADEVRSLSQLTNGINACGRRKNVATH